jgi:carbohydrate kinase (thermoresistant glucokinase family)
MPENNDQCPPRCNVLIVAGPSGAGKTTVSRYLAGLFGWKTVDADFFHSRQARKEAIAGKPMTDLYRETWLAKIKGGILLINEIGCSMVIPCSVLKRHHREYLIKAGKLTGEGSLWIVWLDVPRKVLEHRVEVRDHWFPAKLLPSQLAEAEKPEPDEENTLVVPIPTHETRVEETARLIMESVPGLPQKRI